jgi:hypothetical protein
MRFEGFVRGRKPAVGVLFIVQPTSEREWTEARGVLRDLSSSAISRRHGVMSPIFCDIRDESCIPPTPDTALQRTDVEGHTRNRAAHRKIKPS